MDKNIAALAAAAFIEQGASSPAIVETPDGTTVTFLEKSNSVSDSAEGTETHITFTGHFMFDRTLALTNENVPVTGGFIADFADSGSPIAARAWLERDANPNTLRSIESLFGGKFDCNTLQMEIDVASFLQFSESASWSAYGVDEDDDRVLFD